MAIHGFKYQLFFSIKELGISGQVGVRVSRLNQPTTMPQFNQIHLNEACMQAKARVIYKKFCEVCGKELTAQEIGKRYEEAIFTNEEYKQLLTATKGIELTKIVPTSEIKPYQIKEPYALWFDLKMKKGKPNYTSVEAQHYAFLFTLLNNKPYALIGKWTDRTEKLVALTVENWTGFLTELAFESDSRIEEFLQENEAVIQELNLTAKEQYSKELEKVLNEKFGNAKFVWNDYRNTIKEKVEEVIQRKLENKPLTIEAEVPKATEQTEDVFNELLAKVRA